jgi:hypothetical protein
MMQPLIAYELASHLKSLLEVFLNKQTYTRSELFPVMQECSYALKKNMRSLKWRQETQKRLLATRVKN